MIEYKESMRRRKLTPYEETLAAAEEAKRIARDPNAPSCTDLSKLNEFLLRDIEDAEEEANRGELTSQEDFIEELRAKRRL